MSKLQQENAARKGISNDVSVCAFALFCSTLPHQDIIGFTPYHRFIFLISFSQRLATKKNARELKLSAILSLMDANGRYAIGAYILNFITIDVTKTISCNVSF